MFATIPRSLVCLMVLAVWAPAQEILHDIQGTLPGARFGLAVDEAGDVDGDGVPDLLIAHFPGRVGGQPLQEFFVLSGQDGSTIHALDDENDAVGIAICSVGDVNLDGHADFACDLAAPLVGVQLRSGLDASVLWQATGIPVGPFAELSAAGDVNADGTPDVLVGTYRAEVLLVLSGTDGSVLYQFDGILGEYVGLSVDELGDVNQDGYDDVIVQTRTSFRVYSGIDGSLIQEVFPNQAAWNRSIAGPGDLTGDGVPDILLGMQRQNGAYRVQVHSGADFTRIGILFGDDKVNDRFGWSCHGVGDATGDGVPDFLVGAPQNSSNAPGNGYARLFSGRTFNALYTFWGRPDTGGASLTNMGYDVRGTGDVNGDGLGDMMLPAYGDDTAVVDGGTVQIAAGAPLFLRASAPSFQIGDPLTLTLAEAMPGSLSMLAVTSVNGAPFFLPVMFGFISASEVWSQSFTVPALAAGNTVGLRGYTLDSARGLLVTTEELIVVQ